MNRRDDDARIWMIAGAAGALLLSALLFPLRHWTSASNLAFLFLAFTIIVAEVGGRTPALVTALMSAIGLNFFLTEPFLRLTISKREDVIAFFALAACGLISAAFGKRRKRWSDAAGRAEKEIDILKKMVDQVKRERPLDEILMDLKHSFELEALVIRDAQEQVLAATSQGLSLNIPATQLTPDTLFPFDEKNHQWGAKGFRFPTGGGRVKLQTDQGLISIDLWEANAQGLSLDERRTLAIALQMLIYLVPTSRKELQ